MDKNKNKNKDSDEMIELKNTLKDQKERIFLLKSQLSATENELARHKAKAEQMTRVLLNAVNKADEIELIAVQKFNNEMAQLKVFHDKWLGCYNQIIKNYKVDDLTIVEQFNSVIGSFIASHSTVKGQERADAEKDIVKPPNASSPKTNPYNPAYGDTTYYPSTIGMDKLLRDTVDKQALSQNHQKEKRRLSTVTNANLSDMINSLSEFEDLLPQKIKAYIDSRNNTTARERAEAVDTVVLPNTIEPISSKNSLNNTTREPNKLNHKLNPNRTVLPNSEYNAKTVQLDYQQAQNPEIGLEEIMKELGLM